VSAATISVHRRSGARVLFNARSCKIDGPFLHATGRWADLKSGPERSYSWPVRRVVEVEWRDGGGPNG
jgi:hypothetical protein